MMTQTRRRRSAAAAFTLIELLTVIAIIAVLAAIIFPVFSAVRENARRAQCISNMQQISTAIKQYKLDNRDYPDYLYGPALDVDGNPMTTGGTAGLSMSEIAGHITSVDASNPVSTRVKTAYANSLYPEYIKSLEVFHCPNNSDFDTVQNKTAMAANRQEPGPRDNDPTTPISGTVPRAFYAYDSYDANPQMNVATGALSTTTYLARYSKVWTPLVDDPADPTKVPPASLATYKRQLFYGTPSDDTYVTLCSYHAPKGKVVVLWLSGSAKVLDLAKLKNGFSGAAPYDFDAWRMTPTD